MAQALEQLTRQNVTLTSIGGIVRTMKTLSAINALPYEQAAAAIEAYQHTLEKGFAAFSWRANVGREVIRRSSPLSQLLIVFGSDHGLCGNYNEQLAARAVSYAAALSPARLQLLCVGARMARALEDRGLVPDRLLMPPASVDGVNRLADELVNRIQEFSEGQPLTDLAVHLAFTQRAPHSGRACHLGRLLPLPSQLFRSEQRWPSASLPDFTMPTEALLASLVRQYLYVRLYRASAEAMATENAARLALMQQAEQAVEERIAEVRRELAQVRQEEITTELMDIIIGHLDE